MLDSMEDLVQQFDDVAALLDEVGCVSFPPLSLTFTSDQDRSPYVILSTPHQLPLADQRLAVDRIAARVQEVPRLGQVVSGAGRYGAFVRGRWMSTVVVVTTNAAQHVPGMLSLPERTTTTSDTAEVLRSLSAWAGEAAPHMFELGVSDQSRSHTLHAAVATDHAAQELVEGLILDEASAWHRPGRRYRALLPTGHSLSVSVDPIH